MTPDTINRHIFRAHGVRGIYGQDLTDAIVFRLGQSLAPAAPSGVVVAADHRTSSPALREAMISGLVSAGCHVRDAGTANKGLAVYAAGRLGLPLAYVSASHLPPQWNGVKFLHPGGLTFSAAENAAIRDAFFGAPPPSGSGRREARDWRDEYLEHLLARLPRAAAPLKVLADCGNGTGAIAGPALLSALGISVTALFPELDGRMPNRPSELTPEALAKAGAAMAGHDLGIAWDGDADRVAFIEPSGRPIDAERFAFVILRELFKTDPGGIVANVSCGANIERLAARFSRPLHRVPTGTPHMIGELLKRKAAFGMEASGHLVVASVTPSDDGVAVAGYAAWALSAARAAGLGLAELLAEVPEQPRKRLVFEVADGTKAGVIERLDARLVRELGAANISRLDGLRARLAHGWALVRASNTEPGLRLFVEAESRDELEALVERFQKMIAGEIAAGGAE